MGSSLAVFLIERESPPRFGEARMVQSVDQAEVIGVAVRPSEHPIPDQPTRERFEESVRRRATAIEWFGESLET